MPGKAFADTGFFWLPDQQRVELSGSLEFDPSIGGRLTITVPSQRVFNLGPFDEAEVIHGRSPSLGGVFSLTGCEREGSSGQGGGPAKHTYRVQRIFRGVLLATGKPMARSVTASFTYLNRWLFKSGIRMEEELKSLTEFDVKYRLPAQESFDIGGGLKLALLMLLEKRPLEASLDGEFTIQERAAVCLSSDEPHEVDYFLDSLRVLQDFFSIACLRLSVPEQVSVEFPAAAGQEDSPAFGDLFYEVGLTDRESKRGRPNPQWEFLFNRKHLGENPAPFFQNWFKKAELLRPSVELYMSATYSRGFLEPQFLALCQAVEVYHRRFYEGVYMETQDEFRRQVLKPLLKAIPQEIDSSFRAAIRARLGYLNSYSLRKRLEELFAKHDDPLRRRVADLPKKAGEITDDRNFLTHREKPRDSYSLNYELLIEKTLLLRALLELCFLQELGFPSKTRSDLWMPNQVYARIWPPNRAWP